MTSEELHAAFEREEVIEYHLMGMEQGASRLPGPGWYGCIVDEIDGESGDVEIRFVGDLDGMYCTVRAKNIGIAFRKKQAKSSRQNRAYIVKRKTGWFAVKKERVDERTEETTVIGPMSREDAVVVRNSFKHDWEVCNG